MWGKGGGDRYAREEKERKIAAEVNRQHQVRLDREATIGLKCKTKLLGGDWSEILSPHKMGENTDEEDRNKLKEPKGRQVHISRIGADVLPQTNAAKSRAVIRHT